MSPVCGAECIIDIDIAEGRQRFRKRVVVFFFTLMESKVFKEEYVARFHLCDKAFHCRADAIWRKQNIFAHEPSQAFGHRGQAVLGVELSVRSAQVGTEDDLGAVVDGAIDGRQTSSECGCRR